MAGPPAVWSAEAVVEQLHVAPPSVAPFCPVSIALATQRACWFSLSQWQSDFCSNLLYWQDVMCCLVQGHTSLEGKTKALENFHSFGLGDSASSSILWIIYSLPHWFTVQVLMEFRLFFPLFLLFLLFMKPLPNPRSWRFSLSFLLRVLCSPCGHRVTHDWRVLYFWLFLNPFQFLLCSLIYELNFILWDMDIQLSQHHLLKRFSPLKLSWPSCQKSADHRLVSISGLLVLFLDLYVCPARTAQSWLPWLKVLHLGSMTSPTFFFMTAVLGSLQFHLGSACQFLPPPPLSQLGFLFYVDSVDQFGEYYHPHKGIEFSTNMAVSPFSYFIFFYDALF